MRGLNLAGIAVILFIALISTQFSYGQMERHGMHQGDHHKMMMEKLNLTDQQQTQIEEMRFAHKKKMIDLKADVEKKELGLKELQSTANFSRGDYIAKVEEIISAENKIKLEQVNHHMDVYELLDAEQQKTWIKMKMMKDGKHNKMKKHHKNMNRF